MANEVKILTTTYQRISTIPVTYGEIRTYAKVNSQDDDKSASSYSVKATYYLKQWIETSSWKVVLDGIENSGGYTRFNAGENGLVEITRGMQHAQDGTSPIKNIVTTFTAGFGGGGTTNADVQMPKIDRIPTISSANDFNDEGNGYIKFDNPANFVVKPTLSFYYKGNTTNVLHSITRTSGVTSPYTFTLSDAERTSLRNKLNDKPEYTVRYTLKAYNSSGTYIGEVSTDKTFSFVNAAPTFTPAFAETNSKVSSLLGTSVSSIVKNASNIKVTVTPSAKKGATIKSVEIIHGTSDITKTASPYETTLTAISDTYKIVVTDSRGFTTPPEPITKTLIDYLPIEISEYSFKRANPTSSDIKLNATINYKQQTFGSTANAPTLKWKKGESGTWNTIASGSYSVNTSSNKITISGLTLGGALPYTQSEKFYLSVSDLLTSDDENVSVTVGIPVFDYGERDFKVNGALKVANSDGSVQTTINNGAIANTGSFTNNGNATITGTTNLQDVATLDKRAVLKQGYRVKNLSGTAGSTGYVLACRLTIASNYQNQWMTFKVVQRGREGELKLLFSSTNTTDPGVNKFYKTGDIKAYIVKNTTSVWDLYIQKSEAWDEIEFVELYKGNYTAISLEWKNGHASSLPSGYVAAKHENEYSTSEKVVGTWLNGKPIYRRAIAVTTASGQVTYDVSSWNISIPIDVRGYVIKSGDHRPVNFSIRFTDTGTEYFIACFYASNKIYLQSHSSYAGYSGYVIIEYTKTTD